MNIAEHYAAAAGCHPSYRLVLVAMGFFALFTSVTLEVASTVSVVNMVNWTYLTEPIILKRRPAFSDYNMSGCSYSNISVKTRKVCMKCSAWA